MAALLNLQFSKLLSQKGNTEEKYCAKHKLLSELL